MLFADDRLLSNDADTSVSWPLDAYTHVGFQRKKLEFDIIDGRAITGGKFLANDDQVPHYATDGLVFN